MIKPLIELDAIKVLVSRIYEIGRGDGYYDKDFKLPQKEWKQLKDVILKTDKKIRKRRSEANNRICEILDEYKLSET